MLPLEARLTPTTTYTVNIFTDPVFDETLTNLTTGVIGDTNSDGYGKVSIRSAIYAADHHTDTGSPPSNTVYIPAGGFTNVYTLTQGELLVDPHNTSTINIEGDASDRSYPFGPVPTVIDANYSSRIFNITDADAPSSLSATLSGMVIRHGSATDSGGGVLYTGGSKTGDTLMISDLDISQNTVTGSSGGDGVGGGISATNVAVNLEDTTVGFNFAFGGGVTGLASGAGEGGGLYVAGTSGGPTTLTITHCNIASNAAEGGTLVTDATDAVSRAGNGDGGGIFFSSAYGDGTTRLFQITGSQVDVNVARGGDVTNLDGGPDSYGGDGIGGGMDVLTFDGSGNPTHAARVSSSEIAVNLARGGDATIRNVDLFSESPVPAYGGGAFAGGASVAQVVNSTLYANTAAGGVGRSYRELTDLSLEQTIGGPAGGGGFGPGSFPGVSDGYLFQHLASDYPDLTYTIAHSTITGNVATSPYGLSFGGGVDDGIPVTTGSPAYVVNQANVHLYSTIVAQNVVDTSAVRTGTDIVGGDSANDEHGHNFIGAVNPAGFFSITDPSAPNFPASGVTLIGPPFLLLPNRGGGSYGDLVGTAGGGEADPMLGVFGFAAGGPTESAPPLFGSQVIDNGENDDVVETENGVSVVVVSAQEYDQRESPFGRTYIDTVSGTTNYSDGTDVGAIEEITGVYADRKWATGYSNGDTIPDADPVRSGSQPAIFGYNAFPTINQAIAAAKSFFALRIVANGHHNGSGGDFSLTGGDSENVDDNDYQNFNLNFFEQNTNPVPLVLQAGAIELNSLTLETNAAVHITATNLDTAIGDGIAVTVGGLESRGTLTIDPGTDYNVGGLPTTLTNAATWQTSLGTYDMYFAQASRTHIGTPETAPTDANGDAADDWIDLNGHNAVVSGVPNSFFPPGALFVNNGYVLDLTTEATGYVVADGNSAAPPNTVSGGALVKGSGFYENAVHTVYEPNPSDPSTWKYGGVFQSGNCPGVVHFNRFAFGRSGVDDFNFVINNAAGTAGPSPDGNGQVSGWSEVVARDLAVDADSDHKLRINLQTLANPTTVGNDVAGSMANFDPTQPYSWTMLHWTGTYTGPTDDAALNDLFEIDTSGFQNSSNGTFSLHLDAASQTISLVYTPNP